MATDLHDPPAPSEATPRGVTTARRRGWILLAIAAWNTWLWVTRIVNLAGDPTPRSAGFVAVHAALYGASLLLAAVLAVIGWRMLREARAAAPRT